MNLSKRGKNVCEETILEKEKSGILKQKLVGGRTRQGRSQAPRISVSSWSEQQSQLTLLMTLKSKFQVQDQPLQRELFYSLDEASFAKSGFLELQLMQRERRSTGDWGVLKSLSINHHKINKFQDIEEFKNDVEILETLMGTVPSIGAIHSRQTMKFESFQVVHTFANTLLPMAARTGRLLLKPTTLTTRRNSAHLPSPEMIQLRWDNSETYQARVVLEPGNIHNTHDAANTRNRTYVLGAHLVGSSRLYDIKKARLVLRTGLVILGDKVAPMESISPAADAVLTHLREVRETIVVQQQDLNSVIAWLHQVSQEIPISVPDELKWAEVLGTPKPCLVLFQPDQHESKIPGTLHFAYDQQFVVEAPSDFADPDQFDPGGAPQEGWYLPSQRQFLRRDRDQEKAFFKEVLGEPGVLPSTTRIQGHLEIDRSHLSELVQHFSDRGWDVLAEGKRIRIPGAFKGKVRSSGIDWFELEAEVTYDTHDIGLPKILAAYKQGDFFVRLNDGTVGLLPEKWLKDCGGLAAFASPHRKRSLRFHRTQALLLDALVEGHSGIESHRDFFRIRDQFRSFNGIQAESPAHGFEGQLRPYQEEGLGWLRFLNQFQFGGCLADDMGLGKTVQVLAMLHRLKVDGGANLKMASTLIVVPKSLLHNWADEAARFAPDLKVLVYAGLDRRENLKRLLEFDLVITTYATMRIDINHFRKSTFNYVILDEAQMIKNHDSLTTRAACSLKGQNRLALSGTPIENNVSELGSIFEFINPGMLGSKKQFQEIFARDKEPSPELIKSLSRVIRPFMLRRTKGQVLKDLPEKVESTLYCDLSAKQLKEYASLRDHYRLKISGSIKAQGLSRSTFHILEALLRLRQAACHPGLIDKNRSHESSAKLDLLMEQIESTLAGGHKTLVFSSFVSFLHIVRSRLNKSKINYEYLDGQTRNRSACVERFQTDPDCSLFLISLKAGGLGLNLTAAENCFILDPWWNPAAESQAIDRAHRMGQTKTVFAYKMIAKGTIEEKILELQAQKRSLADAIITADTSFLSKLTVDDLDFLLES